MQTLQKNVPARQRGFTLIEIMVVVVIIGILGAIVVPQFMSRPDQAKVTAAKIDIQAIATALEMYRLDNARYPTTQQGLEALVKRPAGTPSANQWNPNGYLKSLPLDPWNTPYQYLNPGARAVNGGYDVYSLGSDGVADGEGHAADIGNWAID
ncbi:type II secretion system protein GspG [Pseudomonas syringae]|nr:type II secretion system protein GspG [Pseudomonas syringae]MCF5069867.1 type II secretion system protein GspG [Pseudomonas syringae]